MIIMCGRILQLLICSNIAILEELQGELYLFSLKVMNFLFILDMMKCLGSFMVIICSCHLLKSEFANTIL